VPVEKGESLFLSLEDNERRLQTRLIQLAAEDTSLSGFHYAHEWARVDEGGEEQLDAWLTDHTDCRMVVADTLKKVRPHNSGKRSMYEVDYEAIEPFVRVVYKHKTAIVIVHHLNQQPDPSDPYDAFSGSAGLTAAVEGILLLTRQRGEADAYLTVDGKDIEERQELALEWDAPACTWSLKGDADAYKMSKARREVMAIVEDADGPVTPTYVADATDKSFSNIKKMMWEMSRDGQLSSDGSGKYTKVTGYPSNPSNPSNPDGYSDSSVTDIPLGNGNPSNPSKSTKAHTKGRNGGTVTEVTKVTAPQSNPSSNPGGQSGRRRRHTKKKYSELTMEERVQRLVDMGMALGAARAQVMGEEL
jgi:hypothetical protein